MTAGPRLVTAWVATVKSEYTGAPGTPPIVAAFATLLGAMGAAVEAIGPNGLFCVWHAHGRYRHLLVPQLVHSAPPAAAVVSLEDVNPAWMLSGWVITEGAPTWANQSPDSWSHSLQTSTLRLPTVP